jgi:hypothetical protein
MTDRLERAAEPRAVLRRQRIFHFFREIFTEMYCPHSAIVPLIGRNVHVKPRPLLYIGTSNARMEGLHVTKPYNHTQKQPSFPATAWPSLTCICAESPTTT